MELTELYLRAFFVNGTKDEEENLIKQVLKDQEKAKKWNEFKGKETASENYYRLIVERMEKRLEECKTNSNKISAKDDWVEYKFQMRLIPELKKLMEEKK